MTEEPDELGLITEAINAHGIFFKRAVRMELEKIRGVNIIGEEYPVNYLEGAAIDLLVQFHAMERWFILPVECKRAYVQQKRWIFFEDPEHNTKLLYSFDGQNLAISPADAFVAYNFPICVEGVEIDLAKPPSRQRGVNKAANPDVIWTAAFQSCKGCVGFLLQEYDERQRYPNAKRADFFTFPLVITSAALGVNELATQKIDVVTGRHIGDMVIRDVPFLILRHPFTPSPLLGQTRLQMAQNQYRSPAGRGFSDKEGIIVLNVNHIESFFRWLSEVFS